MPSGDESLPVAGLMVAPRLAPVSYTHLDVYKRQLLSLAQADYSYVGLFYAETMARIFNGAKARELSQVWIDPAKIALNLQTARVIGFDPPVDILLAADEVYEAR